MIYRTLGRTGFEVSAVSFGAWAIGGFWGAVDDETSMAALHAAVDAGVNFIDTADVYGDGRSERLIARLRQERKEPFYVATKAGRRLHPHVASGYNRANLTAFVERSLKNLEVETLDGRYALEAERFPMAVCGRGFIMRWLKRICDASSVWILKVSSLPMILIPMRLP